MKSTSSHASSSLHSFRIRWAPLMVHGLLLKAESLSSSYSKTNVNKFLPTGVTFRTLFGFQAFVTISWTVLPLKPLVNSIFPMRLKPRVGLVWLVGSSNLLSAQLIFMVLEISSSILVWNLMGRDKEWRWSLMERDEKWRGFGGGLWQGG